MRLHIMAYHSTIQFEDNFKMRCPIQADIISIICYQYIIKLISFHYWIHADLQTKTGSWGMQGISQCAFIYSNQASANERQCTGWPALALYNKRQCSTWPISCFVMKDCGLIDLQFCCNDRPATLLIVWKIT